MRKFTVELNKINTAVSAETNRAAQYFNNCAAYKSKTGNYTDTVSYSLLSTMSAVNEELSRHVIGLLEEGKYLRSVIVGSDILAVWFMQDDFSQEAFEVQIDQDGDNFDELFHSMMDEVKAGSEYYAMEMDYKRTKEVIESLGIEDYTLYRSGDIENGFVFSVTPKAEESHKLVGTDGAVSFAPGEVENYKSEIIKVMKEGK